MVVEPRREGVRYDLERWGGRWVIRTNADGAVDFKLMVSDAADPGPGDLARTGSPTSPAA